ncbi:MAG: carboxypeptidase regulatory-like domain-containing protein [Candidatus Korobacteraceae bacterium]
MKLRKLITGILALLVIAAVMAPSLMAQSLVTGDITGTVTDPSGAVVSGASVMLKSNANGSTRSTTSSSNGTYRFSLLSPGSYTVSVSASGFSKSETQTSVNIGQATVTDVKMAVGSNSQTVEVTSTAPLVQADNADLSTNFNSAIIQNEPNGGNDLTYVAQTAPGVAMNVGGGYGNFTSSGLPGTSNLFTVNGENDMDPYLNLNNSGATNLTLGKNDLQEATVITNAYSGQYGQQAGAQINYVTKSGTNQFHGNLEYWWTGGSLDANDWFNILNGAPRPFANNNEWATSIGGPIKKDKLFFFLDNEGVRYIVPSTQPVFAPTPNFIAGTLANLAVNDPASLPLYTKYFNLFQNAPGYAAGSTAFGVGDGGCGAPIVGNCIGQYQASPALPGTEFIVSGRIDYNLSDKDHLFWRVRLDQGTQDTFADPINSAFNAASYQPAYDGQGQWTHVLSPNATNNFIYAGSYYRAIFTQGNCCAGFPMDVYPDGVNLTEVGGLAFDFPQGRNVTQYQFVDDFSLIKGAHALKFGANFRRYDITDYTFGTYTNPRILISSIGPGGLFDGTSLQYRQDFPSRLTQPIALWGIGIYGQDEWRVNKSLKLTLALRFEHNSNPVCQLNCGAIGFGSFQQGINSGLLNPDGTTPYNQIVDNGRHQIYQGTDTINTSPRFGFAWSPGGSDKTVVRGGFGIFYDALPAFVVDSYIKNMPQSVDERLGGVQWADPTTASSAAACAAAIQTGFNSGVSWNGANPVNVVNGVGCRKPAFNNESGTLHTPYYEQWSLGIQQAIGDKSSLALGYIGNHGVHIPILNEGLNAFDEGPLFGLPPLFSGALPTTAPTGSFGVFQQYQSSGVSNYSGLTATYSQRVTYGFTVQANYTWSHTMDEVSNGGTTLLYNGNTSLQYQLNPNCLRCNNYGNSDYDIRNYFSASYVWQTPFKFSNKWANGAFGGWTLSQNFFARTGLPYSIIDGFTPIGNYGPTISVAQINQYVNNSCTNGFSQCVPFTDPNGVNNNPIYGLPGATGVPDPGFPNQRRNTYRGPGFFDSDFSINKNFKLTERLAFGVGANFYNIFNHPNFASPDDTIGDSTFGQITATTAPPTGPYGSFATGLPSGRIIQFQGKLVF